MGWWTVVKQVLGKLTDILTLGRVAGLWQEKPGIGGTAGKGAPHKPGTIGR